MCAWTWNGRPAFCPARLTIQLKLSVVNGPPRSLTKMNGDFGVACVGDPTKLVGTTDLLLDGKTETSMTWIGSKLELVFNFSKIQVLNRFRIELAGYQGLVVEEFSSSPDGVIREDLLADLQPSSESLDGS